MRSDTVVSVLLILVGILLALMLFGAGAIWRGKRQNGSRLTNIMRSRVPVVVLGSGLVSFSAVSGRGWSRSPTPWRVFGRCPQLFGKVDSELCFAESTSSLALKASFWTNSR